MSHYQVRGKILKGDGWEIFIREEEEEIFRDSERFSGGR